MKVSNRGCIRRLSLRALLASRTRNLVAVLAIAPDGGALYLPLYHRPLHQRGHQQNNFRQAGGWSHGSFKYLTEEQFEELKDDPLIESWGLRRFVGMPRSVPFNKSHVEIGYSDANEAHWGYCDPIEGRLLPRRAPTRRPPTPMCWRCWEWSRRLAPNSPLPLRWTVMRPPRPLP